MQFLLVEVLGLFVIKSDAHKGSVKKVEYKKSRLLYDF